MLCFWVTIAFFNGGSIIYVKFDSSQDLEVVFITSISRILMPRIWSSFGKVNSKNEVSIVKTASLQSSHKSWQNHPELKDSAMLDQFVLRWNIKKIATWQSPLSLTLDLVEKSWIYGFNEHGLKISILISFCQEVKNGLKFIVELFNITIQ